MGRIVPAAASARHDNGNRNPVYARGYVFSAAATNNRAIMAIGCGGVPGTGCRVQFFSNPNVTFGGVPVGIANQRDNARRINETGLQARNLRMTSATLLLAAETFDNEILARHLATQTMSTNNSAVIANSGSRVSMRAGNSVTLLPGFAANAGSVFNAYINSCAYVPTADRLAAAATAKAATAKLPSGNARPDAMHIYPNPAQDYFILHTGRGITPGPGIRYIITSASGRLLQAGTVTESFQQVDTGRLQRGSYFVNIYSNNKLAETQKLAKQQRSLFRKENPGSGRDFFCRSAAGYIPVTVIRTLFSCSR